MESGSTRREFIQAAGVVVMGVVAGSGTAKAREELVLATTELSLSLDHTGRLISLLDRAGGRELLPAGVTPPLLRLVFADRQLAPVSMTRAERESQLALEFEGGISATVVVAVQPSHLTFRLEVLEGERPEQAHWGPFPCTTADTIGETVGVVRDSQIAVGIQSLGIETIGGARAEGGGSALFAYAIEHDGGVVGSAIALFACPATDALARIGEIEVAEGLPHPMLDGEWGKVSRTAKLSYLISPFGEQTIGAVLDRAEAAGLTYVYHPGPFLNWGHFELNQVEFPEGDASMNRCVETAAERGVRLGVHTLTGFITTNDPYVSPVPDSRLARWGSSTLTAAIDAVATELPIADPASFRERGTLGAAIIGPELVQYGSVSDTEPWRLLDCARGAFGTMAAAHEAGADIGHLADHAYRTLYPGIDNGLMDELTDRLVRLFNDTGLRQISFDGLEGLSTYGYGEYARNRFVKQCYDGWQGEVISDASNLLHYLWHIHTRMNWGEPWGKATRDGMAEYRFANQDYFERNLWPKMLGWFQLRLAGDGVEATSLDDIEWVLSKAAAYDAGFALVSSLAEMDANGQTDAILAAVREWETARLAGAFSAEQRERLRGAGEWHLEPAGEGRWQLVPLVFASLAHTPQAGQPGQPMESVWDVTNPFAEQPLWFALQASPTAVGPLQDPSLQVAGRTVTFRCSLSAGRYLVCQGERAATICDANWKPVGTVEADTPPPMLRSGAQKVTFSSSPMAGPSPAAKLRIRMAGEPEMVGR
ncbi:MAG TPA: hypothetical protein PLQ54_05920 [Armatimonadota bacterium]|nr:hypothetical protein [Armatimonadota bacterium]